MTFPGGGFEIAKGFVSVETVIDSGKVTKTAETGGKAFGNTFKLAAKKSTGNPIEIDDRVAKSAGSRAGKKFGDSAGKEAHSSFGGKFSGLLKGGLVGLAAAGAAVGAVLGGEIIAGARDSIKTTKILQNQIKNLGKEGQKAFSGAFDFAETLGAAIGVDDDDINKVTAKLASFPNAFKAGSLGAEAMERAIKSAFDLQAVGIGSAESNIVGIGKALDNPIKGMSALAKSGVSFTDEQKKQITNLTKQGKLGEAQAILLAGIESNAKGAASAAADPITKAKVAAEGLVEGLAIKLLPTITKIADWLATKVLPAVSALAEKYGPAVAAVFVGIASGAKAAFGWVKDNLSWITPIAAGIGAIALAWGTWTAAISIWQGITKAAIAIQTAWNVVMAMNPIGLIVLALVGLGVALVVAYKKSETFRNIVNAAWNGIKVAALAVWNFLKSVFTAWIGMYVFLWNKAIQAKNILVAAFFAVRDGIGSAFTRIKEFFSGLWSRVASVFVNIRNKLFEFKDNAVLAFTRAKDGIARVWDKVRSLAAKPINFVIETVYTKGIKRLWDGLAGEVGLGELPNVPLMKFAKGGVAPGVGNRDTVPAMLTPGEGILTKKEMAKLGGPKGFAALREQIQYFKDGGIVGWLKDKVSSPVRGMLHSAASSMANKFIRPSINAIPGTGMWVDAGKASMNTGVDKLLSFLKKDDSKHAGSIGGEGGAVGWQKMAQLVHSAIPGMTVTSAQKGRGGKGYHPRGRAIDMVFSDGSERRGGGLALKAFNFIASAFGKGTKELIWDYSPWGLSTGIWNGSKHRFNSATSGPGSHSDHLHWAFDNGGVLPPNSTTLVTNATREREFALTEDKLKNIAGPTYVFNFNEGSIVINDTSAGVEGLLGELRRLSRARTA